MIRVTRLDDTEFFVNAELIEGVETTPDTVLSLGSGRKLVVQEPAEEIVHRVLEYRRSIWPFQRLGPDASCPGPPELGS